MFWGERPNDKCRTPETLGSYELSESGIPLHFGKVAIQQSSTTLWAGKRQHAPTRKWTRRTRPLNPDFLVGFPDPVPHRVRVEPGERYYEEGRGFKKRCGLMLGKEQGTLAAFGSLAH